MAQGERERVGRVGRGRALEREAKGDAAGDGALVGRAVADGRELHGGGRVLVERRAARRSRRQDGPARLPEPEGALHVAGDEGALEDDRLRSPVGDEAAALPVQAREPDREGLRRREVDRAARDVAEDERPRLDHPPARQPASRIDPEHPHAASPHIRLPHLEASPPPAPGGFAPAGRHADSRSSSSAAMSMLDETLCTSSWSSSASSRRTICSAVFPEMATVDCGIIVTSADAAVIVPASSAAFTRSSWSGGVRISRMSPASRTSSAPPSSATSMTRSSSTPARSTVMSPRFWNIHATALAAARLPPCLVITLRRSATVRFRLSVSVWTRIATPPGPYASYVTSS